MLNLAGRARNILKRKSKVQLVGSLTRWRLASRSLTQEVPQGGPQGDPHRDPQGGPQGSPQGGPPENTQGGPHTHTVLAKNLPATRFPPKIRNFILNSQKLFLQLQESQDDVLIGRGMRCKSEFLNQKMSLRFWDPSPWKSFYEELTCLKEFQWRTHFLEKVSKKNSPLERVSLKNTLLLRHRLGIVQLLLCQGFRLWVISGSCFWNTLGWAIG